MEIKDRDREGNGVQVVVWAQVPCRLGPGGVGFKPRLGSTLKWEPEVDDERGLTPVLLYNPDNSCGFKLT
jgi:hypothetical protein